MIARLTVQNFKRFELAVIDFGHMSVFIGPNNAGKTTALQALALWDVGLRTWLQKREGSTASRRTGAAVNRLELTSIPVPTAKVLWHNLKTHYGTGGKTNHHYLVLKAEGITGGLPWEVELEFNYSNPESFYCRVRSECEDLDNETNRIQKISADHKVVYLPPMSGLADREYRKELGEISMLVGQGQTAQVLRNLCWKLASDNELAWQRLAAEIKSLFSIDLLQPRFSATRGELTMAYREANGTELDIIAAGRGCQQTILILSFMLANPGAVMLLDEPDAHLEILRQRDIYNLLTRVASESGSQIVAASHSEILLQEAADKDVVVSFIGKPRRIDTQQERSQLKKALESIPMADYYIAEQCGWMLYLEGATDLSILQEVATRLNHKAANLLSNRVPVHYVSSNDQVAVRKHFHGLRVAKPDLSGIVIFDRLEKEKLSDVSDSLTEMQWRRREIENYLVTPDSILGLINIDLRADDLLDQAEIDKNSDILNVCISELENALRVTNQPDPWGADIKVTDQFLDPLFKNFYSRIGAPQVLFKRDYHLLARTLPDTFFDSELVEKLDGIYDVATRAAAG